VALFSVKESKIPAEGDETTIEAQSASMSAWEVTKQYGDTTLKSAPDLFTAFQDLDSGEAQYVAADAIVGTYIAHSTGSEAKIVGLLQKVGGFAVACNSDKDNLQTAVADAVSKLSSNGTIDVILSKWIGSSLDMDSYSLSDAAKKSSETSESGGDESEDKKADEESSDEASSDEATNEEEEN